MVDFWRWEFVHSLIGVVFWDALENCARGFRRSDGDYAKGLSCWKRGRLNRRVSWYFVGSVGIVRAWLIGLGSLRGGGSRSESISQGKKGGILGLWSLVIFCCFFLGTPVSVRIRDPVTSNEPQYSGRHVLEFDSW